MTAPWIYELSGDLISIGWEPGDGNGDKEQAHRRLRHQLSFGAVGEIALCWQR